MRGNAAIPTKAHWIEPEFTFSLRTPNVDVGRLCALVREASTLFTYGVDYLEIFDAEHSLEEERFICIGPITRGIVVIVTVDVDTDVIRIISACRATRRESRLCEQYLEERSHGRRPS